MARAYTERLLDCWVQDTWVELVVPAGHRVVVRNVLFQTAAAGGAYWLDVLGRTGWFAALPGANAHETFETRLVLYAGERLRLFVTGGSCRAIVAGYLFRDVDELTARKMDQDVCVPQPPPPDGWLGPQPKTA